GAERIGMVDQPPAHDGDRLEPAMRMRRKAGYRLAVVHAPAILAAEVLADVAAGERRRRAEAAVAGRIGVVVMGAEEERIRGDPRKAERRGAQDKVIGRGLHEVSTPFGSDGGEAGMIQCGGMLVRRPAWRPKQVAGGIAIHPFSAPAVSPATILRWNTSTRAITGTVTTTDAAMMGPQGSSWLLAPERSAIATGTVRTSAD